MFSCRLGSRIIVFAAIAVAFGISLTARAVPTNSYYLGGGLLSYNVLRTTASANASTSFMGPLFYPLQIRTFWNAFGTTVLAPRLAYTLLPREAEDGAADTTVLLLSVPVNSTIGSTSTTWDWTYGLGVMFYQIKGKGGLATLNNGTSTSQFARPGRKRTARNMTVEFGLAYTSADSAWRTELEALFTSALSDRRSYSLMLTVNYKLGSGGGI